MVNCDFLATMKRLDKVQLKRKSAKMCFKYLNVQFLLYIFQSTYTRIGFLFHFFVEMLHDFLLSCEIVAWDFTFFGGKVFKSHLKLVKFLNFYLKM